MDINSVHWHDTVIRKVLELPSRQENQLFFEVDYPVDWENQKWEVYTIHFSNVHIYEIHEGACAGPYTILDATELEIGYAGIRTLRLDTTAGYRLIKCKSFSLSAGKISL